MVIIEFGVILSGERGEKHEKKKMDFYDNMPDKYDAYAKSEIVVMVAFEAADAMYPSHWQDPPHFTGLTFPEEAKGQVTVIYQKDPRYGVEYKKLDTNIPGWNAPN